MSSLLHFIASASLIGLLGTALADLWAETQKRLLKVPTPSWPMVGRWVAHLRHGQFIHDSIAKAPPVPGEALLGWATHYVIGVLYAGLLLAIFGIGWAHSPTLLPALAIGIGTLVAPFFILQPGMGAGVLARRTPNPKVARLRSLAAHTAFGVSLFVAALLLNGLGLMPRG